MSSPMERKRLANELETRGLVPTGDERARIEAEAARMARAVAEARRRRLADRAMRDDPLDLDDE